MTKRQIELLLLIAPNPLGEGLKMKEAAKRLGITEKSADDRLERFREKNPDAWKKFEEIRNVSRRERDNLHNHIWRAGVKLGEQYELDEFLFPDEECSKKIRFDGLKIRRKF